MAAAFDVWLSVRMNQPSQNPTFSEAMRVAEKHAWPRETDLGERAPKCWAATWEALEALYRYGSCEDSCLGGDHTLRFIAGRVTNLGISALRHAESGWYDTPLLACRVIHEHASVFALIATDEEAMRVFKVGTWRERRDGLAPRKVRAALNAAGFSTELSDKHLDGLSARLVHPPFESIIATHTPGAMILGPLWQPGGFVLAVNELALALVVFLVTAARCDKAAPSEERSALGRAAKEVGEWIGGLTIDNIPPGMTHAVPEDLWLERQQAIRTTPRGGSV